MFLNICKQTFHISHVHISQKVKGVLLQNIQHIIFIWKRRYWKVFQICISVPLRLENGKCARYLHIILLEICSRLKIKKQEWRKWFCSGFFIVNFKHICKVFYCFYWWPWTGKWLLGEEINKLKITCKVQINLTLWCNCNSSSDLKLLLLFDSLQIVFGN